MYQTIVLKIYTLHPKPDFLALFDIYFQGIFAFSILNPVFVELQLTIDFVVLWNGNACSWPPTPLSIILLLSIIIFTVIFVSIIDLKTWMEGCKPFHPQSCKIFSGAEIDFSFKYVQHVCWLSVIGADIILFLDSCNILFWWWLWQMRSSWWFEILLIKLLW